MSLMTARMTGGLSQDLGRIEMYSVHGFLDSKLRIRQRMQHLPRVGDTVRLSSTELGKITEVIWCLDEYSPEHMRVNLRMVTIDEGWDQ